MLAHAVTAGVSLGQRSCAARSSARDSPAVQYREETHRLRAVPARRNYRAQTLVLLVLTAITVFGFHATST